MRRRTFLAGTGAVLLAAPLAAEAQKPEKMARVGILGIGPVPSPQDLAKSVSTNPFWMSMRQLGWVDGEGFGIGKQPTDLDHAGLLRLGRERRKDEAERENEPDPPHGHLV